MKHKLCTFYIVRHGETEWNVQGRLQGQNDSELTKNGIQQVESLRGKLKNIHFDLLFSSDLLRTQKTAQILNMERKLIVNTTKLIRERAFGLYEGKKAHDYREIVRDLMKQYEALSKEERKKTNHGIESDDEVIARYILFLRETAVAYPRKNVLVVSHGGVMKVLLAHLGFGSYEELKNVVIQNASYIKLESDGTDFFVKKTEGIHAIPE